MPSSLKADSPAKAKKAKKEKKEKKDKKDKKVKTDKKVTKDRGEDAAVAAASKGTAAKLPVMAVAGDKRKAEENGDSVSKRTRAHDEAVGAEAPEEAPAKPTAAELRKTHDIRVKGNNVPDPTDSWEVCPCP